ncbi:MAG: response regulator transcription factor [Weeksellaceae bacterium]|nr:response regulator transcription factor [Weeksellaceae bacterium]
MTEKHSGSLRILIADDHNIVRRGIQMIVEDLVEQALVHQASSIAQIREKLRQYSTDIAILDAQLPDGNCIELLPEIRELYPQTKILIFSSFDEETYSVKFIKAGAQGFLSKLSDEDKIRNAIHRLIETGNYYSPLTRTLLRISEQHPELLNPLDKLSEREFEIAKLFSTGSGNLEIANQLSVRQNTVSTYKKRIFEKLNIDSLVELIEMMKTHHNF